MAAGSGVVHGEDFRPTAFGIDFPAAASEKIHRPMNDTQNLTIAGIDFGVPELSITREGG